MQKSTAKSILNFLGEFTDKELEKEFFHQDMQKAIRYIKPIVLILGILNTLFLIPDYFLIHSTNTFKIIAASRLAFIISVIVLFLRTGHMKNFKVLAYWVTAYEATGISIFLFVFYQYESPDFLIQAFGVMVILLAVFMVPNRWTNMILVSLFVDTGFVILSLYSLKDIKASQFSAGVVYIIIVTFLCCIFSFRTHYYKRIHYINSKELLRLSTTDPLTGAYNRAKFDEELEKWVGYAQRYNAPLSLVIIDFDNFKKINDNFGHFVGDRVMIDSVSRIKNAIRETDVFARWGGEEFVLLLPNTPKLQAVELTERLRIQIAGHPFEKVGQVTCSLGVAELNENDDMHTFLHRADQLLYEAKSAGRNMVMS